MNKYTFFLVLFFIETLVILCGNSYTYYFDERKNKFKPHRCKADSQCDGVRTCSIFGWCQGTSRPEKSTEYYYNESKDNYCEFDSVIRDYFCDGNRTCSIDNKCTGIAR
jgi:hypothetical protein